MDLHRQLIESITDKASLAAARSLLSDAYSDAAASAAWTNVVLGAQARQGWHELNWKDPLELYEVEGRAVGVAYPDVGPGHAWVWRNGWRYVPKLAPKASLEGARYSPHVFLMEFPGAELLTLEALARSALGRVPEDDTPLLTPEASEIPDRDLIGAGYALTKHKLALRPGPFHAIAPDVLSGLDLTIGEALPFLSGWYNFAREELGGPPGTDTQYQVQQILASVARDSSPEDNWVKQTGDPADGFLWELRKAVSAFARDKNEVLARRVRHHLRRMAPSGIFDRRGHRNLWNEYCLQFQAGPPELESAWAATVEPIIDQLTARLPHKEAALLTLAQQWELEDWECIEDAVDSELIRRGVLAALTDLADETQQYWETE